jgi:HlyD family secretion protein
VKRAAIIVSILAGVALVLYLILLNRQTMLSVEKLAKNNNSSQQPTETAAETPEVIKSIDGVITKCKLVPIQYVDLSFNAASTIKDVNVKEGDFVKKGQVIASLSNQEQFSAAIASAELELLNAQQALDILYRNAPLEAALALKDVADAPANVKDAERVLNTLTKGEVNQTDIDIANANVALAEKKLKEAQDAYAPYANRPQNDLTRANYLNKLSVAQKNYDDAVRRLNNLMGDPSEQQISQAEADLALARIKLEEAQRKYEILKDGPDPDQVALADASLKNAEAQLNSAQAALDNMQMKAPFDGEIISLDIQPGQYVAPGVPVAKLADVSKWQVESTNLTELNVVYLQEGNKAIITFDALPDNQFPGTLVKIRSLGENKQGDIVYTVVFDLENIDDRLKWNMTCSANIRFDQQ